MSTPTNFEERLLHELREVVAERPAPSAAPAPTSVVAPTRARQRPRRRLVVAAAGGVAAVLAAVAIFAGSGGTESAYAVTPRADGSVTVKISRLSDAAGLQRALRDAGVPAVVRYGASTDCPAPATGGGHEPGTAERQEPGGHDSRPSLDSAGTEPAPGAAKSPQLTAGLAKGPDGTTFTIDPGSIASGDELYITAPDGSMQSLGLQIAKDSAGACAPASGR
jgi:hypothetical protein